MPIRDADVLSIIIRVGTGSHWAIVQSIAYKSQTERSTNNSLIQLIHSATYGNLWAAQTKNKIQEILALKENFKNNLQKTEIEKYIDENRLLCINNRVYHYDFQVFNKYNNFKKNLAGDKNKNKNTENKLPVFQLFIGCDKDNNSYWTTSESQKYEHKIAVFDKNGFLIDLFKHTLTGLTVTNISVSSAGDLYFMTIEENEDMEFERVGFYKITRRW